MATTYSGGTTTTSSFSSTGYPVSVTYERQPSYNRFYAVPLLGITVKYFMLIPHMCALGAVAMINFFMHLVAWFSVLTKGVYPEWAYNWSSGTIRWSARVYAFALGLTDVYPPFSLGSNDDGYPVQVAIEYPSNPGKVFAIPLIGIMIRELALIPHFFVLGCVGFIVGFFQMITWAPVLFGGQYPAWGEDFVGGWIRWTARVQAYFLGLTDQYPPFSLGN